MKMLHGSEIQIAIPRIIEMRRLAAEAKKYGISSTAKRCRGQSPSCSVLSNDDDEDWLNQAVNPLLYCRVLPHNGPAEPWGCFDHG